MKRFMLCACALALFPALTLAGEIYGTLREGAKTVAKGIKIEVVTPKKTYTAETDAYGSYRLYIAEKGKYTMKVYYNKQIPTFDIYSYDKSTRYDMSLESKDGKYTLRRK